MEGISKARVLRLINSPYGRDGFVSKSELLNCIQELDNWLPIDENTPKDRCIWLSNGKNKCLAIWFRDVWREIVWINTDNTENNFTHYKLLPEDPK